MFWGWLAPRTGGFVDDPVGGFMYKGRLGLPVGVTRYLGWEDGSASIAGAAALVVMSVVTGLIACVSEFLNLFDIDDNLTIPVLSSFGLWTVLKVFG
jgi:diacylglycerol kinase (CTP)